MKDYTPFRKRLGQLLIAGRVQKHLTQKEIAAKLYIDRSVISKMEHGDYNVPLFRIMDYCLEVGLSFSEVIRELEDFPEFQEQPDHDV